jgi:diguanylate cyclase (GGDEF)-like protein
MAGKKLHLLRLPRLIAERRSSAILGVIIILMLWGGVFLKYEHDARSDLGAATSTGQSFAMVFEENVQRSIVELDTLLFEMRHDIEAQTPPIDYDRVLHEIVFPRDIVVQVAIIDANGILRASSAGPQPTPPIDLNYRPHYLAQVHAREDRLFIGQPLVGRVSHKWSVQLSRRFLDAQGKFGGVVVASLDPEHFTHLYDKVDLASSGAIALIGDDGVVRSAGGRSNNLKMGENIRGSALFAQIHQGSNTSFEQRDPTTGKVQLVTLRKVDGQPLWVSVSLDRGEVLAGDVADFRTGCIGAALLSVVILGAMERMFRAEMTAEDKSRQMARLASEDSLTGLLNRRGFQSALVDAHNRLRGKTRTGDQIDYAVLFIDLDRFKVINDTLGHRVGDLLLQEAAQRLSSALPADDALARLGGDEFAILACNIRTRADLANLANRVIRAIREPFDLDGYRAQATISVGIALSPADGENADELLVAADLALYAAKDHGRDNYRFYDRSMARELTDRREIETDLRGAIERRELELHYQPIVDMRDNRVIGFEALARWNHPQKGFVPPSEFIPVAEDTGLMAKIGEWALATACRQVAQLPEAVNVAVNLSPVQFTAPDLVEVVQQALTASALPPQRLELEITERLLLENNGQTLAILRRLRQLGVQIALDDFGTGYSSLSYLRKFPLDKIKIDRSFVTEIATQSNQVAIIQAVLSIARALGMDVTAEGVETTTQQDCLRALGCNSAQGLLFGKPQPFDQLTKFMTDRSNSRVMAA